MIIPWASASSVMIGVSKVGPKSIGFITNVIYHNALVYVIFTCFRCTQFYEMPNYEGSNNEVFTCFF